MKKKVVEILCSNKFYTLFAFRNNFDLYISLSVCILAAAESQEVS